MEFWQLDDDYKQLKIQYTDLLNAAEYLLKYYNEHKSNDSQNEIICNYKFTDYMHSGKIGFDRKDFTLVTESVDPDTDADIDVVYFVAKDYIDILCDIAKNPDNDKLVLSYYCDE